MRLLLDTHYFLWRILNDPNLTAAAQAAIDDPENEVYLSVASNWEAAIKYSLGKLPLPSEPAVYFPLQRQKHRIASLGIEDSDFAALIRLPPIHRDPFDRMLVAQAIHNDLVLMTDDVIVKQYPVKAFA